MTFIDAISNHPMTLFIVGIHICNNIYNNTTKDQAHSKVSMQATIVFSLYLKVTLCQKGVKNCFKTITVNIGTGIYLFVYDGVLVIIYGG